jgi:cytochrome c biogenesis protein CcmG, thiol:disulfide interchange protein DsbE
MNISPRAIGLAASGVGLILFGIAAAFLLPARLAANDPAVATDFSAVPVNVAFEAPSLALTDLQGIRHSLAEYRGRVVLVNLWATWCPPCRAEMPNLQAYFERHQGEGFIVIAIDDGDLTPDVSAFAAEYGLTFPVWLDPTYQATDHAFKTKNLPSSYVIDRKGMVRLAWVGAIDSENLERFVTPLIKEK